MYVCVCVCVCVSLSADISLNCAKNDSTDDPEILWVCVTMPRMYQILVTNQLNLTN